MNFKHYFRGKGSTRFSIYNLQFLSAIMKYQSYILKFYDNFLPLNKTPKQKKEYLTVLIEYLKCLRCLFEC